MSAEEQNCAYPEEVTRFTGMIQVKEEGMMEEM